MRIVATVFICLVMAAAAEAESPTFMELFEVGQFVSYRKSQDQYSITIYTRERKLELLAAKQEHDLLFAREQELTAKISEALAADEKTRLAEEHSLVRQLRRKVQYVSRFHRVAKVGTNFVGLATAEHRTLIIPERSIQTLTLEDAEGGKD